MKGADSSWLMAGAMSLPPGTASGPFWHARDVSCQQYGRGLEEGCERILTGGVKSS